jgi:hypothetical protein
MKAETIEEEATLCRAAFKDSKIGDLAWCVHHQTLYEPLTEPAESRIQYILTGKLEKERAHRLREMRPVKGKLPAEWDAACDKWDAARAKLDAAGDKYKPVLEALHVVECPDSTWNGTSIF